MLLRASIYNGERMDSNETPDWHWFYKMMEASLSLDPYNIDAYYVAQAQLPWEAKLVKETNDLLEKSFKKRTWDWHIPFFIAFNHYYFLKDKKAAAEYYSKAAMIEPKLTPLAGTYFQRAGESKAGIVFLEFMLKQTVNKAIIKRVEMRIESLQHIVTLEKKIEEFIKSNDRPPKTLKELLTKGLIKKIPVDPYGKIYFLAKDGSVDLKVPPPLLQNEKKGNAKGHTR